MKSCLLILFLIPFLLSAQFEVVEMKHYQQEYYDEYTTVPVENNFFFLTSTKNERAVQNINKELYYQLFEFNFDRLDSLAEVFPPEDDYGLKNGYDFEILENSDRFFTVYVSYQRPFKEDRSRRYFTFNSLTGEQLTYYDILPSFEEAAKFLYPEYAVELVDYIEAFDTTKEGAHKELHQLHHCVENYFEESYRLEYGYAYLTDDSVHFVNPWCPDLGGVFMSRRAWFYRSYTFDACKEIIFQRLGEYAATGKWKLEPDELYEKTAKWKGLINDLESYMRVIPQGDKLVGWLSYGVDPSIIFPFEMSIEKKKVYMKTPDEKAETSTLKLKKGQLRGEFVPLDPDTDWVLSLDFVFDPNKIPTEYFKP